MINAIGILKHMPPTCHQCEFAYFKLKGLIVTGRCNLTGKVIAEYLISIENEVLNKRADKCPLREE